MIVAFVLARLFVFQESRQVLHRSALLFVLVNVGAVLQTWGIAVGLANHLLPAIGVSSFVPEIAHAIGIVVPAFSSYLGHRYWSFRPAGDERDIGPETSTGPMGSPGLGLPLVDEPSRCHDSDRTAGSPDTGAGHLPSQSWRG
jgi:hypothetical protein